MAGIAGMSSPNDIKINAPAASPQGVSIPQSEVQAEPQVQDLDALAAQFVSEQEPAQDLDALADQFVSGNTSEAADTSIGTMAKDIIKADIGVLGDVVSGVGKVAMKAAEIVDQVTMAPIRGAADAMLEGKNPISGGFNALIGGETPSTSDLFKKAIPSTGDAEKVMVKDFQINRKEDGTYEASISEKEMSYLSPAVALGIAADVVVGNAVIKGMLKAPSIIKLGTTALGDYHDAKKAADLVKANASVLSPTKQAEIASSSLQKTAEELKKLNSSLKFTPNVIDLSNADEVNITKSLANNAQFQAVQVKQGEDITDAILKHSEAFANIEPKAGGLDKAFDMIHDAAGAEARLIGKYKKQASEIINSSYLGNKSFKMNSFGSTLDDVMKRAGYTGNGRPSIESAAEGLNITQDEATNLLPKLDAYFNKTANSIEFDKMDHLYLRDISVAAQGAQKGTGPLQKIFNDLRKSAGADLRETTANIIQSTDPIIGAKVKAANENFSSVMKSYEKIPGILNKDEMGGDNFIEYIMSGKADVDKFKNSMNILKRQNPELIRDFNGGFMNKLFFDNLQTASAGSPLKYDFIGIKRDFVKFAGSDGKMLDILTGSPEISKQMNDFIGMAEAIGKATVANKPIISESMLSRTLYLASKIGAPKEMISEGVLMASRDKNLMRYLDAAGIERMVKMAPIKDRPSYLNYLRSLVNLNEAKQEKKLKNEIHR